MSKRKTKTCNCDGYWFPHREGSLWCNYATNEVAKRRDRHPASKLVLNVPAFLRRYGD
jgi:hypothetical protein